MFSHHAYLAVGNRDAVFSALQERLAEAGIVFAGNPDVHTVSTDSLSIDDARTVFERTRTSVPPESRRIIIVACSQATSEAQNALLKLTEEPGERTHFFFIVPTHEVLLPTLRSRLQLYELSTLGASLLDIGAFMHSDFSDRLTFCAPMIEEKKYTEALALCNGIEQTLSVDTAPHKEALRAVEKARTYLLRRGSSLKLILEYLSLSVPRTS